MRRMIQRGFSLVELLVVIAMVALLIALLMPPLGRARTMARRAICLSGLHQLHVGFHNYANDNKSLYPPTGTRDPALSAQGYPPCYAAASYPDAWYRPVAEHLASRYFRDGWRGLFCPEVSVQYGPTALDAIWYRPNDSSNLYRSAYRATTTTLMAQPGSVCSSAAVYRGGLDFRVVRTSDDSRKTLAADLIFLYVPTNILYGVHGDRARNPEGAGTVYLHGGANWVAMANIERNYWFPTQAEFYFDWYR